MKPNRSLPLLALTSLMSCSSARSEFESKMNAHLRDRFFENCTVCSVQYTDSKDTEYDLHHNGTYVYHLTWSKTSTSFLCERLMATGEGNGFVQMHIESKAILSSSVLKDGRNYKYDDNGEATFENVWDSGGMYCRYDAKTCLLKTLEFKGYEAKDANGNPTDYREHIFVVTWNK